MHYAIAHHLRELTRAWEQNNQNWAKRLIELLEEINRAVNGAGGKLKSSESQRYREILKEAEKESPPPDESTRKGKRGRLKRTKSRNLLERLQSFEEDALTGVYGISPLPIKKPCKFNQLPFKTA